MEAFETTTEDPEESTDLETSGFDSSAGKTWIYPENYPVRDYQFKIVQAALFNNTLVCLPTGLGKTFIAAVVMYNFWRWYPRGKVVFLAPTKPLVAQQINACHKIMGIPNIETIELTGAVNKQNRAIAWNQKRVIFATPQVFENDIKKNTLPGNMVKCIVIDEAHKALGKHSYCQCIQLLHMCNQNFRVLALSATPGNKIASVQEVLQNLHISHLELRDDTSLDIVPYINERKVEIMLVPLGDQLANYKERYIVIMDRHVKVLIQNNILHSHAANLSKGRIFHVWKEFQKRANKPGNYGNIAKTFNILLSMYHAYELMVRHGLRAFHKFYENHSDKFWLNDEHNLQMLLHDVQLYLGPFPDPQSLQNEFQISTDLVFGHNKFYKLKEILLEHFTRAAKMQINTRAIVFVEYKDIVFEVYILLLQTRPMIRPQMFVGNTGLKQKQQKKALEDFRDDSVNVLISTSIGEEGLDVGEVDLIICFDASQQSPIRLVQRMGRTGRKRDGHIIALVTDGKEHETLKSTMARRDSLNNKILNTSNILTSLYEYSPRMVPHEFNPECHKMHLSIQPKIPLENKKERKPITRKRGKDDAGVVMKSNPFLLPKYFPKRVKETALTKYLTSSKCNDKLTNTCTSTRSGTCSNNTASKKIQEPNIRLLSSDNFTTDFLTSCAMKTSEKELSTDVCRKIDTFYAHVPSHAGNLFNFTIPDINILGYLSMLTDVVTDTAPLNDENIKVDANNLSDYDFWCTNLRQVPSPVEQLDKCVELGESKFEDILDDSSDSGQMETICSVNKSENSHNISKQLPLATTLIPNMMSAVPEKISCELSDSSDNDVWILSIKKKPGISECKTNKMNCSEVFATHQHSLTIDKDTKEDNVKPNTKKTGQDTSVEQSHKRQTIKNVYGEEPVNDRNDNQINYMNELKVADFEWDSDFETASTAITSVEYFGKQNTSKSRGMHQLKTERQSPLKKCNTKDGERIDWMSIYRNSPRNSEEEASPLKLSKKILALKTLPNSTSSGVETNADETFDSDNEFSFTSQDVNKFNQLESDYFNKDTTRNSVYSPLTPVSRNAPKKRLLSSNIDSPCSSRGVCLNEDSDSRQSSLKSNTDNSKTFGVKGERRPRVSSKNKKQKFRSIRDEFFEAEAEILCDTSDESSGTDKDLSGFVSYTQNVHDAVDMQAHYLQAVRSPAPRPGNFVFKPPKLSVEDVDVYSQPLSDEDESYLYDSFCVETAPDESHVSAQAFGYSILEQAEKVLKDRKRKRKAVNNDASNTYKKLKNIPVQDVLTSSDDEIEIIREQIRNK